ncbi:hypothetical protein [Muricoccus radiodurans]|uniref:hypothetical protein n=1 Tax=Muricoccus radiodurans TaxID=2231721 RepID=UPI003CF8C630
MDGERDPRPEAIIVGHSHVLAMGVPKQRPDGPLLGAVQDAGPVRLSGAMAPVAEEDLPAFWNRLAGEVAGRHVALSWRGNQHNSAFLFRRPPEFDLVLDTSDAVDRAEGATLVPVAVVQAFFAPSLDGLSPAIRAMREAGARSVTILGTPPPKGDAERLLALVRKSPHFLANADRRGVDTREDGVLTPAGVRRRLWAVLQGMMRNAAEAQGAHFLAVPAAAQEADGTLRHDLWAEDVTHANAAYGALIRAALVEFLLSEPAVPEGRPHAAPV